ncbi:hypothetical protein FGKAn22_03380 [Ferrigenium kumadai]|uniref:Uncharacterized protein n=1 Tax=Ferrigenium kumadai TaxID=1682490 RepID=A0AAN1VYZ0_9PROT|nr:hypothetical protein [Ferrigenium kumadai]BBI98645.1 hypothetical protein FGKAn22_03380 [Ferrigenium kumadai]
MNTDLAEIILWEASTIFLLVGSLLGVLAGLLLILRPQLMLMVNRVASRWIPTRRLHLMLDHSVSIEHWFYRHHRVFGMLAVLGAVYLFVSFGLLFDKAVAIRRLSGYIPFRLLDGLLDALVLSALVGAAAAFMTGLFLWLRPSLLRGIEADANKWVCTRRATRALDRSRDHVERVVVRHAPRVGWLLLLGSIYLFFVLVNWLV